MIGHLWARELLARAFARNQLGHSYLIAGPTYIGKTSLALYLGSLLVCSSKDRSPCGTCRGCLRLARGLHPDVTLVSRDADKRDIAIEQVRQIEQDLSLQPYEATHKLVCVCGADRMNDAASSALLKTLEEPPQGATLVLTAEEPMALPSTVRSRCQLITLQPVPAPVIADGLVADYGVEPGTAAELAALARGRPGWAIGALADEARVEHERAARLSVGSLADAGPLARVEAVATWLGKGTFVELRERALELLARLESWWRDALLQALSSRAPGLARHRLGEADARGVDVPDIVSFLALIQEATYQVQANVVPRLALENLITGMPRVGSRGDV